jgi:hypothetical protein
MATNGSPKPPWRPTPDDPWPFGRPPVVTPAPQPKDAAVEAGREGHR